MTGKELIQWIEENHAEEHTVIVQAREIGYRRVKAVWEGETDGGAIMIEAAAEPANPGMKE